MTEREIKALAKEIVVEQMRYEVVGADEAAKILGIAKKTLYHKLQTIPHVKYGKVLRFFKGDLIRILRG